MLKAVYERNTIQIELTNACIRSCSNCSRLCGHHKKPFFMDWDTFKKTVDSLARWPKRIGIMGGEPTLHPEFERFMRYAYEVHPALYDIGGGHKPTRNLGKYIFDANRIKDMALNQLHGLTLWSSVCSTYYKHYELIQDVMSFQAVNDHTAKSRHQPWLMTRREFGIPDEQWEDIRDNCVWQRLIGSPSVTPKGGFFCEIAAALDMLFDGPGGWPIEDGWWQRGPEDFGGQLKWCELCAGAFLTVDRDAGEEVDDVSPVMYEKLKEAGSPKLKKDGAVIVHDIGEDARFEIKPRINPLIYIGDESKRVTDMNKSIYPCDIFVLDAGQNETPACARLADAVRQKKGWIAVADSAVPQELWNAIHETIFNPGSFHIFKNCGLMLFNTEAFALRGAKPEVIEKMSSIDEFKALWRGDKIVTLEDGFEKVINPDLEEWEEKLVKGGFMDVNLRYGGKTPRDYFDNVAADSGIKPVIAEIMARDIGIGEKCGILSAFQPKAVSDRKACDVIKTAVHNMLASAFCGGLDAVASVRGKLENSGGGFCAQYALAMITVGREKEERLARCVLDPANTYGLGLSALKYHYDCFEREKPGHLEQKDGIVPELIAAGYGKPPVILLTESYLSQSVDMLLTAAGMKPACFAENIRQGGLYIKLSALSLQNAIESYKMSPLVLCARGDRADAILLSLERLCFNGECVIPHDLTLLEMDRTPELGDIGISDTPQRHIARLRQSGSFDTKRLKKLLIEAW